MYSPGTTRLSRMLVMLTLPPPTRFIMVETTVMPAMTAPQTTHLSAFSPLLQVFNPFKPAISSATDAARASPSAA